MTISDGVGAIGDHAARAAGEEAKAKAEADAAARVATAVEIGRASCRERV